MSLPDRITEIFEQQSRHLSARTTGNDSIELRYQGDSDVVEVEFVRAVGEMVLAETGYFISGIRQYTDSDPRIELWFDELQSPAGSQQTLGTVTLEPFSDEGYDLWRSLRDQYTMEADTVHGDGNITFVVKEERND